jgi:hypothetical protein
MPQSKNIADIKLNLLNPALTSHFEVTIPKPSGLSNTYLSQNGLPRFDQDKLNLLCSEAILPGSQLATHDITGDFHGVTQRHAYRRQFDDTIALTFYVDAEDYLPIKYFETWIKYIAGEQIAESDGRPGVESEEYFYRMNYPKDYMCKSGLEVTKFERSSIGGVEGTKGGTMTYKFVNVFPTSINSMAVSYDASSLLKCSVSLSYVRYFISPAAPSTSTPSATTQALTAQALTAQEAANINSVAFNPNTNLGIAPLTTGGVSFPSAQASGNNVSRAFSGPSLL